VDALWYGGDYNPEQWPREVWDEDVRLMHRAGVTVATVGVFAWSRLEPRDGEFDLGWLDDLMDLLHAHGIRVGLATATASPPAWLVRAHPDVLPVTADGVRLEFGSRQSYHPSSATYRRYATRLVRTLARRYGSHPALEAWHVNNEYGCHVSRGFSPESAAAFRVWLRERYGSVEALNDAWGTAFWSQRYGAFDEVEPPRATPTFPNPTQLLDFDRFSSDALLECFLAEKAILREETPDVPVTTNFMGFFKPVDYQAWAPHVDVVSDDHYPDPADAEAPVVAAMTRDLMRSLGQGRPWILMEQAPSAVNWRATNVPKAPGVHRLHSLQAVARGADGIMQFQWRQSRAGAETFHSAMLPHGGEDTRVFGETVALGAELASLADVRGTRCAAEVALVVDWESWWALEQDARPADLDYVAELRAWYRALWRRGVLVDFVGPDADLDAYRVVVAPAAFVLSAAAGANLAGVVARGGQLVVGYQTGIVDEHLHVHLGGYLGGLRDVLGVAVEEFAPTGTGTVSGTPPEPVRLAGLGAGLAGRWAELVRVRDAEVLATYAGPGPHGGLLVGAPAITRRRSGAGAGWYVSALPADLGAVVDAVLAEAGIEAAELPEGVEVVRRGERTFVLNHSAHEARVDVGGEAVIVAPRDVVIVRVPASRPV
jgi:beta-galactosidase